MPTSMTVTISSSSEGFHAMLAWKVAAGGTRIGLLPSLRRDENNGVSRDIHCIEVDAMVEVEVVVGLLSRKG